MTFAEAIYGYFLFMKGMLYHLFIPTLLSTALISCGGSGSSNPVFSTQDGPPSREVDVSQISDAVPVKTRRSKYGNPTSYVVFGQRYHVMSSSQGYKEKGIASWYGSKFHGKRTSSGEPYDMHAMTAAHKTLPLPTYVKVTNLRNGRQVILKVNDRGPFHENRIIDLSHTAATKLGIKGTGTGLVEVEAIDPDNWDTASKSAITKPDSIPPINTQASNPPRTIAKGHVSPSTAALYLQLGAFVSSHNAYNLKNKINTSVQPGLASVSSTEKNNQQYYRVRIGPINTVKAADELSQTLTQKGFRSARIVID